ncbi:MAG TPA: peptide deformylase [Clostridiaceae bacterium]|nr:peptide deformylase [Clostridiaceae bacterium]
MALRNIVKVNTEAESVLYKKARLVEKFDENLKMLAEDMIETMHQANGVGLAAPQIGLLRRMFVMNVDAEEGDFVIINPEISEMEGESIEYEGCLSYPQMFGKVKRPLKLKLKYDDLNGDPQEMEAEGLKARCICHETDHLDGIMFTEKVIGGLVHESRLTEDADNIDQGQLD